MEAQVRSTKGILVEMEKDCAEGGGVERFIAWVALSPAQPLFAAGQLQWDLARTSQQPPVVAAADPSRGEAPPCSIELRGC